MLLSAPFSRPKRSSVFSCFFFVVVVFSNKFTSSVYHLEGATHSCLLYDRNEERTQDEKIRRNEQKKKLYRTELHNLWIHLNVKMGTMIVPKRLCRNRLRYIEQKEEKRRKKKQELHHSKANQIVTSAREQKKEELAAEGPTNRKKQKQKISEEKNK